MATAVQGFGWSDPPASAPTPPSTGGTIIAIDAETQKYVIGNVEQVIAEDSVDFSLLSGATITAQITALTGQSGVLGGTYNVRVGGTIGNADGVVVATISSFQAPYALPPDRNIGVAFARPTGPRIVKLTAVGSDPTTVASIRGYQVAFLPAPVTTAATFVEFSNEGQKYVVGANEQVIEEDTVDFDLLTSPTVVASLAGLTEQTGGASGTYRVRIGGTLGLADGTIVCTLTTMNASYVLPPDEAAGAAFARPVGPQLVKLTANSSTLVDRARIRGFQVIFFSP